MRVRQIAALLLVVVVGGCASTGEELAPGVTKEGKYLIWYDGPEISAELDFRTARYYMGEELLMIRLSLASVGKSVVSVAPEAVRLRTPDGRTLVLMSQEEFRLAYAELRADLTRTNAWRAPTDSFARLYQPCGRWLLAPPGATGSFVYQDPLIINANRWCGGPLVFRVPVGVQPGRWMLMIDLEESDVRIPFELGS